MFKFIHAADLHLDSPLKGLERYEGAPVETIRQATRRALENLIELAITQKVAFVVIAGDLYDGDWKEFRTGLYFVSQMVKLREAGIPVHLIAGNHDAANKMTRRLPLPDNVHVFSPDAPETIRIPQYDVAIHGQSFARGAVIENLSVGYPTAVPGMFNLGLLHTAASGREGHEPYAPCTLDDLRAKQYDYWALGHVHKRETLCEDPPIVFAGNTQGRHIREAGPKGCILVTVDDHRITTVPHWLDVLRWEPCTVNASHAETGYDVLDQVRQGLDELARGAEGRSLAVRVDVVGPTPAHRALTAEPYRWTNEIRAAAQDVSAGDVWIEKVTMHTQPPRNTERSPSSDGPMGELLGWIAELRTDPSQLAGLAGELADLLDKLPPELKEGAGALRLEQPAQIHEILDQVEQLLVHQLQARKGNE